MAFKHSPERDEELLTMADAQVRPLPKELAAIVRKWRAKAMMREQRIKELESENTKRENDFKSSLIGREGER